jgi:hypothetical protein
MSNIEAIIVDGVRYDKVKAKTGFVCEECELREVCEKSDSLATECKCITEHYQCWKRKE